MSLLRTRAAAVGWTLVILAACSIPGRDLPSVDIVQIDKIAHFAFFAVLGGLWMGALTLALRVRTWCVLVLGLAYAALTEVYQGLLPFDRTPDPLDALANALGLLTSLFAYHLWQGRTRKNAS